MASGVRFNTIGYRRFLNRTVQPYLRKKAEEIAAEARRNAPHGATGELANSIRVEEGNNGSVNVVVSASHASYVMEGTGPQANPPRPAYYPRLRRRGLILWSESKGLNPGSVAQGIAQKGTKPNPFFENAVEKVLGTFNFKWIRRDLFS